MEFFNVFEGQLSPIVLTYITAVGRSERENPPEPKGDPVCRSALAKQLGSAIRGKRLKLERAMDSDPGPVILLLKPLGGR